MCNEHNFKFKGYEARGVEKFETSVPFRSLYEIYFCEKRLETRDKFVTSGHHIKCPEGTVYKGYGNDR